MDAYLAAFALAGRYSMVTTDAAFRQFRGLDLLVLGILIPNRLPPCSVVPSFGTFYNYLAQTLRS